jgi:hypothetical protein
MRQQNRQHPLAYVSICQHTLAYVSIHQHTSAYVSIRQQACLLVLQGSIQEDLGKTETRRPPHHPPAYVGIRQHTSAYVSIRQHTSAYGSIRQRTAPLIKCCEGTCQLLPSA